jgi:hypothetical protein
LDEKWGSGGEAEWWREDGRGVKIEIKRYMDIR